MSKKQTNKNKLNVPEPFNNLDEALEPLGLKRVVNKKPVPQFEGKPKPTINVDSSDALKSPPFTPTVGPIMIKCPYCLGTGKTYFSECAACKGHGKIDQRTFKYPEEQ